jgi:hypothetical protein
MRARVIGAAASVVLHALLGLSLMRVTAGASPPPRGSQAAEKRESSAERIYGAGLAIYTNPGNTSTATGLACAKHSYIGIGVMLSFQDNHIIAVGDNTPAARAGLREGDIIANVEVLDYGQAKEGTIHHLIVSRGGLASPVRVVVGRICSE